MMMSELGEWLTYQAEHDEDREVVIRSSIGWSGIASYDVGVIGEILIPKDRHRTDGDYDTWRDDVRKGKVSLEACDVVFALCHEGYEADSVHIDDLGSEEE